MNTHPPEEGMSPIVRTVCRGLKGFVLLYGIYIILYGHLTPGGGFAGGVIAACAYVLILLAEGSRAGQQRLSVRGASTWDSIGALLFLGMAALGLWLAGTFFAQPWGTPASAHFTLFSGGGIPVCNIGIGIKVCCSLYLVILVLHALGEDRKGKKP